MKKSGINIPFLKTSASIFLIRLSLTLANLFVFAFLSHRLPVAENGDYLNFYIRITMLSLVACAGITMLIYSYSISTLKYISQNIRKKYLILYLLFVAGMATLLVFLHFNGFTEPGTLVYVLSLIVYFITFSGNFVTDAIIIVGQKERWLVVVNMLYAVGFAAIHILVFFSGYSLQNIIGLLAVLSSIKFLINTVQTRNIFRITESTAGSPIHILRIKKYFVQVFLYDLSQIIFRLIDKFMITLIVASGLSAIYINGTLDIPFIPLVFASVCNTALIRMNQKQSSRTQILETLQYTSRIMATIALAVFFFLFVFRTSFITFFFSDKYLGSVPIFAISLFKLLTYLITVTFFLQYRQKGKILNIGALIDIGFSLGLLYPLYHWIGLEGVILSFVIGTLIQIGYYAYQSARLLHISLLQLLPLKNWIYKILVLGGVSYATYYVVSAVDSQLIKLLSGGIVVGGAALLLLYWEFYRRKEVDSR